jgi:UDP-N-acetylglucosamine 3-dehydrogenase
MRVTDGTGATTDGTGAAAGAAASTDGAAHRPLRGVIVGLGVMGSHHLRILTSLPGVEVVAAVERDAARRDAALRSQPGVRGYTTLEHALSEHGELDFACLAVPVGELPVCAGVALGAGLNVFVEKPMAPNEERAREMIALASEHDLVLGVGYVERFNPAVVALKRKLDAGAIGRVLQMHARRLSPFPNRDRMAGVALDLATHDIDIMRNLSSSEVERVYAESIGGNGGRSNDLICAVMRFDSGTTGLLEVNWITPTKVRELSILGEGGMFVVNYLTQDLTFYEHPTRLTEWSELAMHGGGEGDMIRYALERREPLRLQWEAFIDAVARHGPAPVDGLDGLATLSTARAIHAAGVQHRTVAPSYRETSRV